MSRVSISEYFVAISRANYLPPYLDLLPRGGSFVNPDTLIGRMERLNSRRKDIVAAAERPVRRHPDARLLKDGAALEAAWQSEINAWIAQKRLKTPEAFATAREAREATASIVRRIENTCASTPEGLDVWALALSWRRFGGPFGDEPSQALNSAA
jgi:hypothetical protein